MEQNNERKTSDLMGKKRILFIVMPYLIKNKFMTGNNTRSILAFPYGALSIATYLKTKCDNQ